VPIHRASAAADDDPRRQVGQEVLASLAADREHALQPPAWDLLPPTELLQRHPRRRP